MLIAGPYSKIAAVEAISQSKSLENPECHRGLEKILAFDYRLSFKFSQGKATLQEILFLLLGVKYSQRYRRQPIDSLLAIDDWMDLAMPPKSHQGVDKEHIERESVAESEKFRYYISHPDLDYFVDDIEAYRDVMASAITLTLERDIKYVGERFRYISYDRTTNDSYLVPHATLDGRPRRPDPIKYGSLFKKYVIHERPTGSDAFNAIFQDMRAQVLAYPSPLIVQLAEAWESRHHGKSFYTADFAPLLQPTI
jgi:hypothetical protein